MLISISFDDPSGRCQLHFRWWRIRGFRLQAVSVPLLWDILGVRFDAVFALGAVRTLAVF